MSSPRGTNSSHLILGSSRTQRYSFLLPSGMRILNGWVRSMALGGSYGLHSSISKDTFFPRSDICCGYWCTVFWVPHFCYLQTLWDLNTPTPRSIYWCFSRGICLLWCSDCSIQWKGPSLDALSWESHVHAWVCLTFWDSPLRILQPYCCVSWLSVSLSLNLHAPSLINLLY